MKGGSGDLLQSSLVSFERELCKVLDSIGALEEPGLAGGEAGVAPLGGRPLRPFAHERTASLALELAALLEANSMAALTVWDQLRPLLHGVNHDKLDAAIDGLDFSEAGKSLRVIAEADGLDL